MGELQVNHPEHVSAECSTPPDDRHDGSDSLGDGAKEESMLARQVTEFRQQRERWELHRQEELERLRREGDLLAEAWQRLEAEERCLLAERELLRRGSTSGSPNPPPTVSQASTEEKPQTCGHDQDHTAWMQFQQLRREFQRYGRRAT